MQRPEAWPRPHPGEGAAAAQIGAPAPPARAGEPAGSRVWSRRAGAGVRGGRNPGRGGGVGGHLTHNLHARRRELGAATEQPWEGAGPGRAARKSSCGRGHGLPRRPVPSPRGAEVLDPFGAAMGTACGWGRMEIVRGGVRSGGAHPRRGGWGRAQRVGPASTPRSAGRRRHRCPPGPGSVIHSDSGSGAVSA